MSSYQRTKAIVSNEISVLVCTPTYALHLAEVAEQEGLDLANSDVRITIHAGEPGASLPATKLVSRRRAAYAASTMQGPPTSVHGVLSVRLKLAFT
jgi:phenylacetate-coenzyme A ligase PaaK-like adenylate-forming protein